MKFIFIGIFLFFSSALSAQTNFCAGKAGNTFYCVNDTEFQHCTGVKDGFVLKSCPAAICVTRSPANRNPCVGREAAAREDGLNPPIVDDGQVVDPNPPVVTPPPVVVNPPSGACVGGPKFDVAGEKNVGNGRGIQFIGGQCLSSKDCASGCCAGPCGICSGPGAQFQAGKTGCGFGDNL